MGSLGAGLFGVLGEVGVLRGGDQASQWWDGVEGACEGRADSYDSIQAARAREAEMSSVGELSHASAPIASEALSSSTELFPQTSQSSTKVDEVKAKFR